MHKIISNAGRVYCNPYTELSHTRVDASELELHEIQCSKALRLAALKKATKAPHLVKTNGFTLPAMELITERLPKDFFLFNAKESMDRHTAPKWRPHLDKLERWTVIEEIAYAKGKHYAYYFAVPKGEDAARAIWNGRSLSRSCRAPPNVNLPYMPEIIKRLLVMMAEGGSLSILTSDFSHYFHLIPVSEELSLYFGVAVEDGVGTDGQPKMKAFRWTSLPMGWSFSPWIAQSIGWAAILFREADEEILFEVPEGLAQLPTFVRIKGGGFICLYYDNVFACAMDPRVMERVRDRLTRNFSNTKEKGGKDGFNVITNYMTVHTAKSLRDPLTPAQFLGVDFSITTKRDRVECAAGLLRWRQTAKKHAKWLAYNPVWTDPRSARDLTSYIGKILWRHSLTLLPLCALAPVIKILRRVACFRHETKCTWDDVTFLLTEDELLTMTLHWDIVTANAPQTGTPETQKLHRVRLCSDSCDDMWGYLVFTDDGKKDLERGHVWSKGIRKTHIFIKELLAAVFAIRFCLKTLPRSLEINIGIDNTAAAAAIRNMYSGNIMACEILDQLSAELKAHDATVRVWGLRSEDNASDPASRGKIAHEELVDVCFRIMLGQEEGHRLNVPSEHMPPTSCGGLRHEQYEEDDIPLSQLLEAEDPLTGAPSTY